MSIEGIKKMLQKGCKILFLDDDKKYTVKAFNERYAICTRPYNLKKTVIYTIIDFDLDIRGTNNLVFNIYDYKSQKDIDQCLEDLASGEVEVSRRNSVELFIYSIGDKKLNTNPT